jgi:putative flippase GtrA
MRRIPPLLALLAATLLLMSVAFADGRPTVFYDSHSYDVMGRDLIETVRDWPASNRNKADAHLKIGDWPVPADGMINNQVEDARSPYYGVLLHGTYLFGSIWVLAALQSFLAAWVVYLLWRTMAPRAPSWSYLGMVAAAAAGTSISFFTTFAMPDVFAGIGGAAVVLILAQGDRLKKLEIAGLWALVAYSMAIHKSHWATGLIMAFGGGLLLLILGLSAEKVVRRVLMIVCAAAVAWTAGAVFNQIYANRTGHKLGHPPFIMARVLADGPGREYLKSVCLKPGQGGVQPYTVCRFQSGVSDNANQILWSSKAKDGVFNVASWAERNGLEREEMRFVLGVVKFDPLGQFSDSLWDWGQQLVAFQVIDPLRNPADYLRGRYWPTTSLPKLIPNFQACRPPGSCRPPFSFMVLDALHGTVLAISLLLLIWRMSLKDVRSALWRRALKDGEGTASVAATVLLLIAVVVVNAAVCGILSGPFARYQSRLIWLVPIAMGLIACALPMGFERLAPMAKALWTGIVGLWERARAQPVLGRFLPPLDGHFMRFCCVGGLGFVIDFTVLKTVVHLGLNPFGGRWVSFSVAVVSTWTLNRAWTFKAHTGPDAVCGPAALAKEFAGYLAVQSVGFSANFSVYAAMIVGIPALNGRLLPAVVCGTAVGLVINYLGAKHLVFRRRTPPY